MFGAKDAAVVSVIILLIAAGGTVASGFLAAFVWAVRSGQFDDTCTPAVRVLLDARVPGDGLPTFRPLESDHSMSEN
jgi:cbb3-type cytochrome oxidase maturation protein